MTTGRINQITIFEQSAASGISEELLFVALSKVVRFGKGMYDPNSNNGSKAPRSLPGLVLS